MRIMQRRDLNPVIVHQFGVIRVQPAVFQRLLVQERAGIRRGQRHLDRVRIDLGREFDRFLDRFLGLPRQAHDEGAVDFDTEFVAVLGELLRDLDPHALLDVVQDLLIAAFVADQQQPQPVVAQHLQRRARHIRLGVARPRHTQLAQFLGDGFGARQVVRKSVVVEEQLPHLREILLHQPHFLGHMAGRADAVVMPADGLRPEAEGAAGFAAATRVQRHVGVHQVADEIVLDPQVALVDLGHERQLVHVLQDRPILVMDDHAGVVAVGDAVHRRPIAALGDFLDREVEFVARHEIDGRALRQAFRRLHRHLGTDHTDFQRRINSLQRRRDLHVRCERRRGGMQHAQFEVLRLFRNSIHTDTGRRRVDQLAARHQSGGLRQPSREPERLDLPLRLIAGSGAAVEPIEGGRLQEQGLHHRLCNPFTTGASDAVKPAACMVWPRQSTRFPA